MKALPLFISTAITMIVTFSSFTVTAQDNTAVADNGREVILKENGEWEYVSEDLYATTPDGQRIRLKPNKTWNKVSNAQAPVYQPVPIATINRDTVNRDNVNRDNVQLGSTSITLDEIHIENQRETQGKNKRLRSNLVFYIDVAGTADLPNTSQITVQDSRGKDYRVFAVTEGAAPVGGQSRLIVRAKGAPRWWGVKFFSVQFEADALGNSERIELRKPMQDVLRKEVEKLPQDNS